MFVLPSVPVFTDFSSYVAQNGVKDKGTDSPMQTEFDIDLRVLLIENSEDTNFFTDSKTCPE